MKHLIFALLVSSLILLSGCAARDTGMEPVHVCTNLCSIGQTQAAYPDCSCSGGSSGGSPGVGGGVNPVGVCTNMCGIGQAQAAYPDCSCSGGSSGGLHGVGGGVGTVSGGSGLGYPGSGNRSPTYYEWEYVNDNLYGAPAAARDAQGMMLVTVSASHAGASPLHEVSVSFGPVAAFTEGQGAGWVYASVKNQTVSLSSLENASVPIGLNRMWVGRYARLAFEVNNITALDEYGDPSYEIAPPQGKYVVVIMGTVEPGATSSFQLVFDLEKSFTRAPNGTYVFTPSIEVRSLEGVNYIVKDDGAVVLYSGSMALSENARFNETGASSYSILGGTDSLCVQNCTRTCALPSSPGCHVSCASGCLLEPSPSYARFCSDGTPFGECSRTQPFLCLEAGTYLADCSGCGCPENQACTADGTCRAMEVD